RKQSYGKENDAKVAPPHRINANENYEQKRPKVKCVVDGGFYGRKLARLVLPQQRAGHLMKDIKSPHRWVAVRRNRIGLLEEERLANVVGIEVDDVRHQQRIPGS